MATNSEDESMKEDKVEAGNKEPASKDNGEKQHDTGEENSGWEVDWPAARKEFSKKKLWKERTWGNIGQTLTKVFLLSLLPSVLDVGTDSLGVRNFIMGANYTKIVPMFPEPNDTMNVNCTHIKHFSETNIVTN